MHWLDKSDAVGFYKTAIDFFLDTLFPKSCLGCGREDVWLCDSCLSRLECRLQYECCPFCDKTLGSGASQTGGMLCSLCRRTYKLDGLLWVFNFKHNVIQKIIKAMKYYGIRELARPLSKKLYELYLEIPYSMRPQDITDDNSRVRLVPIPLHRRRQFSRGYNQAQDIAEGLSQRSSWAIEGDVLLRRKATSSQTVLVREERLQNVQDAFRVRRLPAKELVYILIDDVVTSGATLSAAARCLKEHGAKTVWGMALAKG